MSIKVDYYNASRDGKKADSPMTIAGNRRLQIKDGRTNSVLNYNGSDKFNLNKATFDLNDASYCLFEKVASMDGHKEKDLTEEDVKLAQNLKGQFIDPQSFYKVSNVISNNNGQTIFTVESKMGNTTTLTFDYETDDEKKVRESAEQAKRQNNEAKANEAAQPKQQENTNTKDIKDHSYDSWSGFVNDPIGWLKHRWLSH